MRVFFSIVLGLIALFVGGCSLVFTAAAIFDWNSFSGAVLVISVPALALGLFLGWLAWSLNKSSRTRDD